MQNETREQRTHDDMLADAVRVLTEAARHVRTWTDPDGAEHQQPADWAEFVTHALAGAVANIGGIESALAGRPGSWEADKVRDLLCATVGDDEQYLLEHRTEPLIVRVHVVDILGNLGVWALFERAYDELERREDAICADGVYPEPISHEQAAELAGIDELRAALHAERRREWAAYGEAFRANVLQAADELLPTLPVPVEVIVELGWKHELGIDECDGPVWRLWEAARATPRCPIPVFRSRTTRPARTSPRSSAMPVVTP